MKKIVISTLLLALTLSAKNVTFNQAPDEVKRVMPNSKSEILSFYNAIKEAKKSVVNISTKKELSTDREMRRLFDNPFYREFFGDRGLSKRIQKSLGSGVVVTKDGYIVVKIKSINNPQPKTYENAKPAILAQLQADKKISALKKKAESRLGIFRGKDIGFVSRDSKTKVPGLNASESLEFINFVFDNNKTRNFKILGEKAVLYQILEQDLLSNNKAEKYATLVNDTISQMKQTEINQNLVVNLKKRYDIEQYYKGN